jgi:protein-L-isoaspartate(D-aspartate) O-methyltransferase
MLSVFFRRQEPTMLTNVEQARQNMIENQVRTWDVLDLRVLDVLAAVPREAFVPPRYRDLAFADMALPLGEGESMLKPVIEGRLLQALAPTPGEDVLEIGTGSGFLTACLARLARRVTSVERREAFAQAARARLAAAQVGNAEVMVAEAVHGFEPRATFDVVVGGGVHALPERFRAWVRPGGRLFAFIGDSPAMQGTLLTRLDDTHWRSESLFETDLPYLAHAEPPRRFTL